MSAEPALGGIDEIERALTDLDADRARYIACFAYILGRVARADHQVTRGRIRRDGAAGRRAGRVADAAGGAGRARSRPRMASAMVAPKISW